MYRYRYEVFYIIRCIDIDGRMTPGTTLGYPWKPIAFPSSGPLGYPLFPDNFGFLGVCWEGWYGLPGYPETDLWLVSRRPKPGIPGVSQGYPGGVVRAPRVP
jgi:hypothetical protein